MRERTDTASVDDAALVDASQAGDIERFNVLFERHVGLVRTVIRDNVRDPDDLADCVQEVFARALENLDRLDNPDRFRSWLLAIARHVAIDGRRRRVKDVERVSEREADDLPARRRTPSAEIELRNLGSQVRGALAALPEREATAVALATYLDFKPTEIAAALGVEPGNAKVIVHRARRRLRNALTLEMLSAGDGCDEFQSLGTEDLDRLGEHVAECEHCQRRAHSMLHVG
ncbi:MAG: sigma-70 family RNA polymerase sigma factor [Acidimicrobiales bacterium]|nr:sigma-70 family RNA polymerase sigma factor [Acidimicrobiales bacterium]